MKSPLFKFLNGLCILTIWNFTLSVQAGWTSSGGETLKDKINPWYFYNTKKVNYCILVDNKNFGQDVANIRKRVRKSLQIWKHQLQNLQMNSIGGSIINSRDLTLATQDYTEVSCSIRDGKIQPNNIDLTFQFGVLTGEQISKIGDPTKYIGLTVRTDYDAKNLKAKGFIYFSPEAGPLKLNKVGLIDKPWSSFNGRHLLDALIHELGHTYGIQHTSDLYLMDENYLDSILTKSNSDSEDTPDFPFEKEEGDVFILLNFFKFEVPDNFLFDIICRSSVESTPVDEDRHPSPFVNFDKRPTSLFSQLLSLHGQQIISKKNISSFNKISSENLSTMEKFFGYSHNTQERTQKLCFNILKNGNKYRFELIKEVNNHRQTIGTSETLERFDKGYKDQRPIIRLWIPKDQKVFNLGEDKMIRYFSERSHDIGLIQLDTQFKGAYRVSSTGETRPFFIQAKNFWRISFGGLLDGKLYLDLEEEF